MQHRGWARSSDPNLAARVDHQPKQSSRLVENRELSASGAAASICRDEAELPPARAAVRKANAEVCVATLDVKSIKRACRSETDITTSIEDQPKRSKGLIKDCELPGQHAAGGVGRDQSILPAARPRVCETNPLVRIATLNVQLIERSRRPYANIACRRKRVLCRRRRSN